MPRRMLRRPAGERPPVAPQAFPSSGSFLLRKQIRSARCPPGTYRKTAGKNFQEAPARFFFHPQSSVRRRRPAAAALSAPPRRENGRPGCRAESRSNAEAPRRLCRRRLPRYIPRALFHPQCIWSFLPEESGRRRRRTGCESRPFSDRFPFRFG